MKKKLTAGPMNKSGTGSMSKSGTGSMSKSGASSMNKSGTKLTNSKPSPKAPTYSSGLSSNKSSVFGASSSKSYPSFATNKTNKSSTSIGILWIPTKKHNKHKKDVVYTGVNNAYPKGKFEKSPSMYGYMSGDSADFQPHKKKEEEIDLLMSDKAKAPATTIAAVGAAIVSPEGPTDSNGNPEEKQEFIRRDKEETKEAAGDTNPTDYKADKSDDYLDNEKVTNKSNKQDPNKEKYEDKVDSVYLRPPPPHKARSTTSIVEDDGCGMKCLYYTLQCCDCVLQ